MKSLLNFRDNAIFLKNWRERMRFPSVVSAVMIAVVAVALILIEASVNEHYTYHYKKVNAHSRASNGKYYGGPEYDAIKILTPWLNEAVYNIAVFQGM